MHGYELDLTRGAFSMGSGVALSWDGMPHSCWGRTALAGTVDDPTGTDNLTGTLEGRTMDLPGFTGRYTLTLSGSAVGTDAGDLAVATRSFTDLHLPAVSYAVRSIDPGTCVVGSTVCSGTATLALAGSVAEGSDLPLLSGHALVLGSTAGSVLTRGACSSPWSVLIQVSGDALIGPLPASTEPGAYFGQL